MTNFLEDIVAETNRVLNTLKFTSFVYSHFNMFSVINFFNIISFSVFLLIKILLLGY